MEVRKTLLVGHSAAQMFDLIESAEHYPEFLPWCSATTIVERDASVVAADVWVDYHGVRFQFRTRNPKRPPEWMALRLEHGPFHRFEGEWNLTPLAADGCRIDFLLRYDFKSVITRKLAGPVFDRIANTLVDAFVARADVVYPAARDSEAHTAMGASTDPAATMAPPSPPSVSTSSPPPREPPPAEPFGAGGGPNRSDPP